jgi:sarcosine oxidase
MARSSYDYIVLGCGGIGSAAAFWLSRRAGTEVLGLEQFELGHSRGGSQDFSRIIRLTYHDDKYTCLTPYTYLAWSVIEDESALKIVHKTGGLTLARERDDRYQALIESYARSMAAQGIPFDRLNSDEVMRRFPQWHLDEEVDAIYQADMGLVDAIMGKILSELAIDGQISYPIDGFTINRPATSDPNFPPGFHTVDMSAEGQAALQAGTTRTAASGGPL